MNGLGYGILPSVLVQDHPNLNRIILKDKKGNPLVRKTWMWFHKNSLEFKVVKEFIEFVKKLDFTSAI